MSGIFICYRRDDTGADAGRLRDALVDHFGADLVFRDIEAIRPGINYRRAVEEAISSSDVVLALIGRRWLSIRNERKQRALDDPGDDVRVELETALSRGVRLIPVLVERAQMPSAEKLPPSLAPLTEINSLYLSQLGWEDQLHRLIEVVEEEIPPPPTPEPEPEPEPPTYRWAAPPSPPESSRWGGAASPSSSYSPPPTSGSPFTLTPSEPASRRPSRAPLVAAVVAAAVLALAVGGGLFVRSQLASDETPPSTVTTASSVTATRPTTPTFPSFPQPATIKLSKTSGPPGTSLTVSGTGYQPGETVVIQFHTDVVGRATAKADGSFAGVTIVVPAKTFRDQQYEVVATGERSIRFAMHEFNVT